MSACKSISPDSLSGRFSKVGKDYSYYLNIRTDSTFTFEIKVQGGNPECIGKVFYYPPDSIKLICDEETEILIMLSNGYMNERERTVEIINKNKLKIGKVKLRRRK